MKKLNILFLSRKSISLFLALIAILLISLPAAAVNELHISYKLDPRLLGPTYGGPRWVSPPLYDVISGGSTYTIEMKAQVENPDGGSTLLHADWTPADPDLITVTYNPDRTVMLHIHGQGESTVKVTVDNASKTLYIAAAYYSSTCNNLRVMVSQTSQPDLPAQTCFLNLPMVITR